MEQNINNAVTEQQGGLSGVGRIDQNGGGNNHMAVVAVDGGSGIPATGSYNEQPINASEDYFNDGGQFYMSGMFDMLDINELKQVRRHLDNELTQIKEKNDALRAEYDRLQAEKQELLNKFWRKVAEHSYPDFPHVMVPPVMEASDPPNCARTGHGEGPENGGEEVAEGSSVGDNGGN
ncbi:hypothetical protein ACET3Z_009194 [Daucus carota]